MYSLLYFIIVSKCIKQWPGLFWEFLVSLYGQWCNNASSDILNLKTMHISKILLCMCRILQNPSKMKFVSHLGDGVLPSQHLK